MKFNFTELDLEILQEHAEEKSFEVEQIICLYELEQSGMYKLQTTDGDIIGCWYDDINVIFVHWNTAYELLEKIAGNIEDWGDDKNPWNSLLEIVLGSMKEIK